MEPISLNAAQEAGFEPRTYAPCRSLKQMRGYVDFIAEMGESTISLFFRDSKTEERLYAALDLNGEIGGSNEKSAALMPYLQRNDLCNISVVYSNFMLRVHEISLIKQASICTWREQCDQRSPCCVFKS